VFKKPLEPLRTPILPSTSLPPRNKICYWTYYSDTMFNNELPVSSLFCKISLLCLPHCLPAHIHFTLCSSSFCALCTIPIQCTFCLLSISTVALHLLLHTLISHNSNNTNLFFVPHSYSLCACCAFPIHNPCALSWCRVLCLFIIWNSSTSLFVTVTTSNALPAVNRLHDQSLFNW